MGSLYDLLLDYVDSALPHDSNYEIARALVSNYTNLPNLTLREMSELCFVSQASFSRFCRFLGFSSFAEFKEALDGADYRLEDDYTRGFMSRFESDERGALAEYQAQLTQVMGGVFSADNLAVVPQLLDALEQANRVAFFSHHFLWHIGRYLQGKLLALGTYVELYQSYEHQLEAAEALGQGDLAIVCSVNGTYFSHYPSIARALLSGGAKVAVITQNAHALYLNRADFVLGCGSSNDNDVGKYAALMTIDYLVMSYLMRTRQGAGRDSSE